MSLLVQQAGIQQECWEFSYIPPGQSGCPYTTGARGNRPPRLCLFSVKERMRLLTKGNS